MYSLLLIFLWVEVLPYALILGVMKRLLARADQLDENHLLAVLAEIWRQPVVYTLAFAVHFHGFCAAYLPLGLPLPEKVSVTCLYTM